MKTDEIGEAMRAEMNRQVTRSVKRAKKDRGEFEVVRSWEPETPGYVSLELVEKKSKGGFLATCSRPGCGNIFGVAPEDYDVTRPWFCGATCFRMVRDWVSESRQTHKLLADLSKMPVDWEPKTETRGGHRHA